jgi:hypothetical protein
MLRPGLCASNRGVSRFHLFESYPFQFAMIAFNDVIPV